MMIITIKLITQKTWVKFLIVLYVVAMFHMQVFTYCHADMNSALTVWNNIFYTKLVEMKFWIFHVLTISAGYKYSRI